MECCWGLCCCSAGSNREPVSKPLLVKSLHVDFELNPVSTEKLENMIKDKKLVYNYNLDQRAENKFSDNEILEDLNFDKLPKYVIENKNKYEKWLN